MSEQKDQQSVKKIQDEVQASAPARRYRPLLFQSGLILVAGAFAALTLLVKAVPSFAIDLQITTAIQLIHAPFFASLMGQVSWPGFAPQFVVIAAVIILWLYHADLRWESFMALVAASFSTGINLIVKDWIGRPRPASDLVHVFARLADSSYPSGHVMFYMGFYGFVGFLAYRLLPSSVKRSILLAIVGGLVALIGVSRIYLGQHWASDVLGAYLLGSLTLEAYIQLYLWGKPRYFAHPASAPGESQAAHA